MQKEEIKSKRRSRELEGPESWREHRAMINHHDRRAARERQVCLNMWLGIQDKDKHIHSPVMHMSESLYWVFLPAEFLNKLRNLFVHFRSNERDLTQRDFLPRLRTALQRTFRQVPPPLHRN